MVIFCAHGAQSSHNECHLQASRPSPMSSLTIQDDQARQSLCEAIHLADGVRVAREVCSLVREHKQRIVRNVCLECIHLCLPKHCTDMVLFCTRRPRTGKAAAEEEAHLLCDAVTTIMIGAHACQHQHGVTSPSSERASPSCAKSFRTTIDQLVRTVEQGAAHFDATSSGADAGCHQRWPGAREDSRFATALQRLPANLGRKWAGVVHLASQAAQTNCVQEALECNERLRSLVLAEVHDQESGDTPEAKSLATPNTSVAFPSSTHQRKVGKGEDESLIKLCTLWTYDREKLAAEMPYQEASGVHQQELSVAVAGQLPEITAESHVNCVLDHPSSSGMCSSAKSTMESSVRSPSN